MVVHLEVFKYELDENLRYQMENQIRWVIRTHPTVSYLPGNKGEGKKPDCQYRVREESDS